MRKKISIKLNHFLLLNFLNIFFDRFFFLQKVQTEKERNIFTKIWCLVWLKEGYAVSREMIIREKKKYEPFSKDFLIKFLNIPIGTIRIIYNNSEIKLPTINNFKIQKDFNNQNIVELSLFSILKYYRFFSISSLISIKKIYQLLKKENVSIFITALDWRLFLFLKNKLKIPLYKIGEKKIYEGSLTLPCYLDFKKYDGYSKKETPELYKFFISGCKF